MHHHGTSTLEWITGIGTLAAVAVAPLVAVLSYWLGTRRDARLRPRLAAMTPELVVEGTITTVQGTQFPWQFTGHSAFIRVPIAADRKRLAAEDVEVLLRSVSQVAPAAGQQPRREPIDISFPAIAWTHVGTSTTLTIPPGVTRTLDLAMIDLSDGAPPQLRLLVIPQPADERNVLPPGRYAVDLIVSSRNADARTYRVEINWDGGMNTDQTQMRAHVHLSVREL
jgi:hypothetical protein